MTDRREIARQAPSKRKYDYLYAVDVARLSYWPERGQKWKRILRRLVRDAVLTVADAGGNETYGQMANRIAKELVPDDR